MTLSPEFLVQLGTTALVVGIAFGAIRAQISAIEKRLDRMENRLDRDSRIMAWAAKTMPADFDPRS